MTKEYVYYEAYIDSKAHGNFQIEGFEHNGFDSKPFLNSPKDDAKMFIIDSFADKNIKIKESEITLYEHYRDRIGSEK